MECPALEDSQQSPASEPSARLDRLPHDIKSSEAWPHLQGRWGSTRRSPADSETELRRLSKISARPCLGMGRTIFELWGMIRVGHRGFNRQFQVIEGFLRIATNQPRLLSLRSRQTVIKDRKGVARVDVLLADALDRVRNLDSGGGFVTCLVFNGSCAAAQFETRNVHVCSTGNMYYSGSCVAAIGVDVEHSLLEVVVFDIRELVNCLAV